jgi:hypothetical protein
MSRAHRAKRKAQRVERYALSALPKVKNYKVENYVKKLFKNRIKEFTKG